MARESVPRFDLYAELEVSRSASVEVIEAAYRSLAKRHHPDVAAANRAASSEAGSSDPGSSDAAPRPDADRIKRLNVAREWLTDATRRRRYDSQMGFGPPSRPPVRPASSVRTARGAPKSTASRRGTPAGPSPGESAATGTPSAENDPGSFGVNSAQVRQFLADLRALDELRALQLRAGRFSVMHPDYAAARRAAHAVEREQRQAESLLAREAAAVIARGKVADPKLAEEIATIAADIAGAIALRDLLPRHQFELLLAPWTWRGGRIGASPTSKPAAPAAGRAEGGAAAIPRPASEPAQPDSARPLGAGTRPVNPAARIRSASGPPWSPALAAGVALIVVAALAGGIALVNRPPTAIADGGASPTPGSTVHVGAETDAPSPATSPSTTPTTGPTPSPSQGIDPALLRELRRGAARTIRNLASAAATGNLAVARDLLGETAPGLQRSGLAQASFPDATAADVTVVPDGEGWLATVDDDTLRSLDGETWTFDYGDRPLAVFAGTPDHDLFWLDPRHDLFLRVTAATVTRSEVRVRFAWTYGAGGADAFFFDPARLWLASLSIGNRAAEVGLDVDVRLGAFDGAATLTYAGTFRGASNLALVASVTPPNRFTNQSTFELSAR